MKARYALWSLATASSAAMILAGVATSAQAASPAVPPSDSHTDTITLVGSDTTQFFDEQMCDDINANSYGDNPSVSGKAKDYCSNIYAFAPTGGATSETSPADSVAPACTWYVNPTTDPNSGAGCPTDGDSSAPTGSGAGQTALAASAGGATAAARATVDVGRSSSDQCTGKGVLTETCYAFARDAVGWAKYRSNVFSLTVQQIQDIYSCQVTNWSQIPGSGAAGTIQRYFPQAGSGTGSFFITAFLNGVDPRTTSYTACGGLSVVAKHVINENDASQVPASFRANAILPFSAASWIAQVVDQPGVEVPNTIGTTKLSLGGVKVGSTSIYPVTGATTANPTPNPTAFNEGTSYPGARYVFHNLDTRSAQYGPALHFYGVTTSGSPTRSVLCNNGSSTTPTNLIRSRIKQYGFQPLTAGTNGYCRIVPGTSS